MDASPVHFQSYMFWGFISQAQVLQVGVPDVGFTPLASQGEAWSCESLLALGQNPRVGL